MGPTAVILAAGLGARLRGAWPDEPKGCLRIGGETLVERQLRLLAARGVTRTVVVGGYRIESYRRIASTRPGVEVVDNPAYAETDSMASLDLALARLPGEDVLVLESDLYYEPRALDAVLGHQAPDVVLASGPTGAGDEVWVEAPGQRVLALSKDPARLRSRDGEYVGVVRVSAALGATLRLLYSRFVAARGHGGMAYDTEALDAAAARHALALCLVPDLLWGEIDDLGHLARVRDRVAPAVAARVPAGGEERPR
jgi:choline kinase